MLDFVIFALEVLEYGGLFDDVVGELLPLHIAISIDVYLLEEVGQVAHQPCLAIGQFHLPKLEVPACDVDELRQV